MLPITQKLIYNKILSAKTFPQGLVLFTLATSLCLFPNPSHALVVSADTGDSYPGLGYGAQVLDIILDTWKNPDPTVEGTSSITLRIAKDGRPFSCEIRKFSSSQVTDTSLCDVVAKIGKFPTPAGNQNSEIVITFVHEKKRTLNDKNQTTQSISNATKSTPLIYNTNNNMIAPQTQNTVTPVTQKQTNLAPQVEVNKNQIKKTEEKIPTQKKVTSTPQASSKAVPAQEDNIRITREEALMLPSPDLILPAEAMKEYSQNILNQARKIIKLPAISGGTYKVIARVDLDPKGVLKGSSIQKSSGQSQLDNEILRVLQKEVTYPPTPHDDHQSMWLTFIIQK